MPAAHQCHLEDSHTGAHVFELDFVPDSTAGKPEKKSD
jgi:hypothetical protein